MSEPLTEIRVVFAYYSEPADRLLLAGELLQGITAHPTMKLKAKDQDDIWIVTGFGHLPPEAVMANPPKIALGLLNSVNPRQPPQAGQHLIEVRD